DYEVGTLPAGILGETNVPGRRVTISADASGQGWFVDPTPLQDEEFAGGPAMGTMDLLTAVLHEMGHLVGQPDVSSLTSPLDLMGDALAPGVRLTGALDRIFAAGV